MMGSGGWEVGVGLVGRWAAVFVFHFVTTIHPEMTVAYIALNRNQE